MTMQEYFDKTVAHLRSMDRPAVDELQVCHYLLDDGRKCAVGVHIPDGHPGQNYGGSVDTLIHNYPDLVDVAVPDRVNGCLLALDLQRAHDSGDWGDNGLLDGEERFQDIAARYNLTYTAPEEV